MARWKFHRLQLFVMCKFACEDLTMSNITIDIDLTPYLPEKEDAYVSYNGNKRDFYVSTVDDDKYSGRITMDAIVDDFIECNEIGRGGNISNEDAAPFLEDLEKAIAKVKARLST